MAKLKLLLYTLVHIKPIQVWYQIYYRIGAKFGKASLSESYPSCAQVHLIPGIPTYPSYKNRRFNFLNLPHSFEQINWNFSDYGKLWTYNLNYFEYLQQPDFDSVEGFQLVQDFVSQKVSLKDGLEPYPTALRIINLVKFLSRNPTSDKDIQLQLYQDCLRLSKNLEYHLLANHLLEDGFGLLFGAYYFQDVVLYKKAKKVIISQLKEQILEDGGHYELSPMYHQIILSRVLDSYNLVTHNDWQVKELKSLLKTTAEKMLSWLKEMTFSNGEIPHVNDATKGIAPTTEQLLTYAEQLGITSDNTQLSDSGYRMFRNKDFELLCDVGQIAPTYQPGHSHADNLNFLLCYKNQPIIVDTGISTYEKNARRQTERGTAAHNTVVVNQTNSSQVWSGFRVAKRARTNIIQDQPDFVVAEHDGYRQFGLVHRRHFEMKKESGIFIQDEIKGNVAGHEILGYIHFHPEVKINAQGERQFILDNQLRLIVEGALSVELTTYLFADGYNRLVEAPLVVYKIGEDKIMVSIH